MRHNNFSIKKTLYIVPGLLIAGAMTAACFSINESNGGIHFLTEATPARDSANAISSYREGLFIVEGGKPGLDYEYDESSETLVIKTDTPVSVQNANPEFAASDRIKISGLSAGQTADVTLCGVNIMKKNGGAALEIEENAAFNVVLTLAENTSNCLVSKLDRHVDAAYAGLQKNGNSSSGTLTIQGKGSLRAEGANAAGIGSAYQSGHSMNACNIRIQGGNITAVAGSQSAGIGSGQNGGSCENITISGGMITAQGDIEGAGIGGGLCNSANTITICGGTVKAIGGSYGTGIGGASGCDGTAITIRGGTVTAEAGSSAAAIGGGQGASGRDITISGGMITAIANSEANAIGDGMNGEGSGISISGGTILAKNSGSGAGIGSLSGNTLNGNATVIAESASGDAMKGFGAALEGLINGLIFTRNGNQDAYQTAMYGSVTIQYDVDFPMGAEPLQITADQALTIDNGVKITIPYGMDVTNNGVITASGTLQLYGDILNRSGAIIKDENIAVNENGCIRTYITYDPQQGSLPNPPYETKIYKDHTGIYHYNTLAETTWDPYTFLGWYAQVEGQRQDVTEQSQILLNAHTLCAAWDDKKAPEPMPMTEPEPASDLTIRPGQGGKSNHSSAKTGDLFADKIAFALLGTAATVGVIACRKRKRK